MSSTRDQILEYLLNQQLCTINDLAAHADINPISVRHHINKMEAEGIVTSKEERHGVGRPRRLYFLTDQGRELFPTRYLSLTTRILEQLKGKMPDELVASIFKQIADEITIKHIGSRNLDELDLEGRIEVLRTVLSKEGFTICVEKQDGQYIIKETSCPYFHVSKDHPEICILGQTLIASILDTSLDKVQCILEGDAYCAYISDIPVQDHVSFIKD